MIYLICAQNSKRRIVEFTNKDAINTSFYKYAMDITNHKNVMYPYSFYRSVTKSILPNRVNVIFTTESKRNISVIVNGIIVNSVRDITSTYSNHVDDLYIIATNKTMIDYFGNRADYLIVYETDSFGRASQDISDSINFANYNLLKTDKFKDHKISYFVVSPNNYLGN